eukprot:2980929-Rhodomonas_salina.1
MAQHEQLDGRNASEPILSAPHMASRKRRRMLPCPFGRTGTHPLACVAPLTYVQSVIHPGSTKAMSGPNITQQEPSTPKCVSGSTIT